MRQLRRQFRRTSKSWPARLGLVAAVVALLIAGMATATLARGSAVGPAHNKPTSTDDNSGGPAAPDPLTAPAAAPGTAVTQAQKTEALNNLHDMVLGAAVVCSQAYQFFGSALGHLICVQVLAVVVDQYVIYKDPPDPNHGEVAVFEPTTTRSVTITCAKRTKPAACTAVRTAALNYVNALQVTAAVAHGMAVTVNRFSGAAQDGSDSDKILQAATAKSYAGDLAAALLAQQKAGGVLALAIRRAGLDVQPSKADFQKAIKKLETPGGIPASVTSKVIADGLVTSNADIATALKTALQGAKNLSVSGAFGRGFSTAGLTQLYKTLTGPELATVVRALSDQGVIETDVENRLLIGLRQAVVSPAGAQRNGYLVQFAKDSRDLVGGAAGSLLGVAAGALVT